jgi:hypothetical protein
VRTLRETGGEHAPITGALQSDYMGMITHLSNFLFFSLAAPPAEIHLCISPPIFIFWGLGFQLS